MEQRKYLLIGLVTNSDLLTHTPYLYFTGVTVLVKSS